MLQRLGYGLLRVDRGRVEEGGARVLLLHQHDDLGAALDHTFGAGSFEMRNDSKGRVTVSFMAERTRIPAPGLFGGEPGACGKVLINGAEVDPKVTTSMEPGDTLTLVTPGGGGYGSPV